MKFTFLTRIVALAFCLIGAQNADAVSECTGKVQNIWTGNEGYIWVAMSNGASWYLYPSDPDLKNILSMAGLALATDKTIVVRFTADAVPCPPPAARGDVEGMYILK